MVSVTPRYTIIDFILMASFIAISSADSSSNFKFTKGFKKNKGLALKIGKIRGIFVKKLLHVFRNPVDHAGLILLLFIIMWPFWVSGLFEFKNYKGRPLSFDLTNFERTVIPTTAGIIPTPESKRLEKLYSLQFGRRNDVKSFNLSKYSTYNKYALRQAKRMGTKIFNNRVIVGFEATENGSSKGVHVISHYNGQPLHAEPIGINYMMNSILQFYLDETYSVQFVLHPLPMNVKVSSKIDLSNIEDGENYLNPGGIIGSCVGFIGLLPVTFYWEEQQTGKKHLQIVNGASAIIYWLPSFLWDVIGWMVVSVFTLVALAIFNVNAYVGWGRTLLTFFHLVMFSWANLPYMYMVQILNTSKELTVLFVVCINSILGSIFTSIMLVLPKTMEPLKLIFMLLLPYYNCLEGFVDIYTNYENSMFCKDVKCFSGIFHRCCKETCQDECYYVESYISMSYPGIGKNILVSFISGILYFTVVILLEYGVLQRFYYSLAKSSPETKYVKMTDQGIFKDVDVINEETRINSNSPYQLCETEPLLLVNLFKEYKGFMAVNRICLGIKHNECFGLLGKNGAGKTTVFKMLTGETKASEGNAYIAGHHLCGPMEKVHENLGYCPQDDNHFEWMTGRETLTLFGRLRGVPETSLTNVVQGLLDTLVLTPHADKYVSAYSGGSKRKLSTAIALIGMSDIILLDEPTTGVDPQARRQIWNVLSQVRAKGHTLVLTSHNMEENEVLCTSLTIMVRGQFICLGSPQHIKNKFGQGYTVVVQMKISDDGTTPPIKPIFDYICNYIEGCQLVEEVDIYSTIGIPDSRVKLSYLFGMMEACKQYFPVEDYSVQQTSLEQVFIAFTQALPQNILNLETSSSTGFARH